MKKDNKFSCPIIYTDTLMSIHQNHNNNVFRNSQQIWYASQEDNKAHSLIAKTLCAIIASNNSERLFNLSNLRRDINKN